MFSSAGRSLRSLFQQLFTPGKVVEGEAPPSTAEPEPGERRETSGQAGGPARLLLQAAVFGFAFGFLLQKGGVAKFDILIGQLLLEKFTVIKVMLSAIVVGMVGVYFLNRVGVLQMQVKDTVLGSNIAGGLLFGLGFGLIAYCPGTDAAAVGQGNYDAIIGILGMIFGSYLFALSSNFTGRTVSTWGQFGKVTLPQLLRVSPGIFIAILVPVLIGVLVALEAFTN
jgi:hypothetical protein